MNKDGTVLPKVYVPVKASFDAEGKYPPDRDPVGGRQAVSDR